MVKFEFGQKATFTARPVDRRGNPARIQPGSAEWTFIAEEPSDELSESVSIVVNPSNELEAEVTAGDVEVVGVLKLTADGDPDADEFVSVVGTASIIVDSPNVVAFELTNTEPTD